MPENWWKVQSEPFRTSLTTYWWMELNKVWSWTGSQICRNAKYNKITVHFGFQVQNNPAKMPTFTRSIFQSPPLLLPLFQCSRFLGSGPYRPSSSTHTHTHRTKNSSPSDSCILFSRGRNNHFVHLFLKTRPWKKYTHTWEEIYNTKKIFPER